MIIKEDDAVITHFGVSGMKWGVRKERYQEQRKKASNILKSKSDNRATNISDLKAAEWMSKSVPDKISGVFFKNAVLQVSSTMLLKGPEVFNDPKEIANITLAVAKKSVVETLTNEATSGMSLRRYTQSGVKDSSKKQYGKKSLTPEDAVKRGIKIGVAVAPMMRKYGGKTIHQAADLARKRKSIVDARMKAWGPNLLDNKVSDFHTIYDDGYTSVLERIKKG